MNQDKQTRQQEDRIRKYNKKNITILLGLLWILSITINTGVAYFYGKESGKLIQVGVYTAVSSLVFIYVYSFFIYNNDLDYDNIDNPYRFLASYCIVYLISLLLPLIPVGAWPFLSMAIVLSIFSNTTTGLIGLASVLITPSIIAANQSNNIFFVYIIVGLLGIVIFKNIDEEFKVNAAIAICSAASLVIQFAGFILLKNEELSFEQCLPLVVNVCINWIVLFSVLKFFYGNVVDKYSSRFLELNDQEFVELRKLKELHTDEYYRSIHTAHFTNIIAGKIGCDENLTRSLSYYHRIKHVYEFDEEACKKFLNDYAFPPSAKLVLMDYYTNNNNYQYKECYLVALCSRFVVLLQKIYKKDPNIDLQYDVLVERFLEEEYKSENFVNSSFTQKDYLIIKNDLIKEYLYYVFIR